LIERLSNFVPARAASRLPTSSADVALGGLPGNVRFVAVQGSGVSVVPGSSVMGGGQPLVLRATAFESTGGRVFYGTPSGQLMVTPPGYVAQTAMNGKGLVLLPEGQAIENFANTIRWGDPNKFNPNGYFRYYDAKGRPINPQTGKWTLPKDPSSHIQPSYQGAWLNLPE
jgi:hypothetical protein